MVQRGEIVTITVKDITARCPECGETRFRRQTDARDEGTQPVYRCVSCNRVVPRSELLKQIGDEAARRSRGAAEPSAKKDRPGE